MPPKNPKHPQTSIPYLCVLPISQIIIYPVNEKYVPGVCSLLIIMLGADLAICASEIISSKGAQVAQSVK